MKGEKYISPYRRSGPRFRIEVSWWAIEPLDYARNRQLFGRASARFSMVAEGKETKPVCSRIQAKVIYIPDPYIAIPLLLK